MSPIDGIAARAGEVIDDRGDPHRHPPAADLERERPSDAADERREPRRHEHGGRGRVGRLAGADPRVVLLVDPVGELDAVPGRAQHDAALAEPRLRGEAAEAQGAGQRAAGVGSAVDEPRRHELERDELAAAQSRRQRAVEVRRGIDPRAARAPRTCTARRAWRSLPGARRRPARHRSGAASRAGCPSPPRRPAGSPPRRAMPASRPRSRSASRAAARLRRGQPEHGDPADSLGVPDAAADPHAPAPRPSLLPGRRSARGAQHRARG